LALRWEKQLASLWDWWWWASRWVHKKIPAGVQLVGASVGLQSVGLQSVGLQLDLQLVEPQLVKR
jgi:hypothetical protein